MHEATLPTKYLYIVGRGHSGSTIFSMLVSQAENVASEGEVMMSFREGYEAKRCANGEVFAESPFWQGVKAAFERRTDTPFDHAVGLLHRRANVAQVPAALLSSAMSPDVLEAKRLILALYDSIAEVSGRAVVLDASKELATALFLLRHVPEAKLIHFVRSPFGVADSYVKRVKSAHTFEVFRLRFRVKRFYFLPMIVSSLLWTVEAMVCELARLLCPTRVVTLHYEDLCDRPVALLEKLESFAGIPLTEAKTAADQRRVLQPNHSLSANHLMRRETIAFSPKKGVPRYLTAFDKAIVTLCTFPMTLAYGYLGRRAIKPAVAMRQLPQ